jgi:hypothetical protein
MTQYRIEKVEYLGTESEFLFRDNEDGSITHIPKDPANSDYQRYLNPEAEQSTPIVTADE